MKANQKFARNDEAVSPVIGVILMVAITVVLAAVVFILVNDLGSSEEDAPDMGFSKDNDSCTLTVVKAPSGGDAVNWAIGPSSTHDINVSSSAAITGVTDGQAVNAGDILTLGAGSCSGATLTIRHVGTNTLLYETEYA